MRESGAQCGSVGSRAAFSYRRMGGYKGFVMMSENEKSAVILGVLVFLGGQSYGA